MKTILRFGKELEIRSLPADLFEELTAKHAAEIFSDAQYFFRPKNYYSSDDVQKITALKEKLGTPIRLNFGAFHRDDLIGWSWGAQESSEVFHMINSAVLPQYRNQGIYTKLATSIVDEASVLGFQVIYSRHVATNNAVLVPKLKAGFHIAAFELSDQYGVLVHLRRYMNPTRRKMLDFRAGAIGPDPEIKNILKI